MRFSARHLLLALALAALPHCGGGAGSFASKDTKDTKDDGKDEKTDGKSDDKKDDEKKEELVVEPPKDDPAMADVPLIVSGAYLACADDPDGTNESNVTCRLADKKTDKAVTLADLGTDWKWSALPKPSDTVIVKNDGSKFTFTGGDAATRKAFVDQTVVMLQGKLKTPVKDFEFFGSKIADAKPGGSKATFTSSAALPESASAAGNGTAQKTPTFTAGEDRDKDGVKNEADKCNNTPANTPVWTTGAWIGCSQGEFLDSDDGDLDGVANVSDRCIDTPYGMAVDKTAGSARRGCNDLQTP